MRRDMKKKLVETYRVRSGDPNADVRRDRRRARGLASRLTEDNELEEDFRRASGMRMKDQYSRKQFGENLAPLSRFLWSSRGKHWDSVYSEISKYCDKGSTVGNHIFEHLWGYVVKDAVMVNGKPHEHSTWREGLEPITSNGQPGGWKNLYIHPKTGVLLEGPLAKKKEVKQNSDVRQLSDLRFAVRADEVWYLVELGVQKYREEKATVTQRGDLVEKQVKVPVYEDCVCPEKVFEKLPRKVRRYLRESRETRWPLGYGQPATYHTVKAALYMKVAKTMSKKEKRDLL